MEEVLLEKLIHDRTDGYSKTVLRLEEVDILREDVGEVGYGQEGVVGVDYV
jgi:hypothetical protein